MCGSAQGPGQVCVESEETCEVKFHCIAADVEQVSVDTKDD